MGFDVFGLRPKSEKGRIFLNNIWAWSPLWEYVCQHCDDVLTSKQIKFGYSNDGIRIHKWQAQLISKRLDSLIDSGEVDQFKEQYGKELAALPDEPCPSCGGTGERRPEDVKREREGPKFKPPERKGMGCPTCNWQGWVETHDSGIPCPDCYGPRGPKTGLVFEAPPGEWYSE